VLGERPRRLRAALEAATAVDTFVRIADRADDIGLRAARNLRRFGWLLQQLAAIPPRPEKPRSGDFVLSTVIEGPNRGRRCLRLGGPGAAPAGGIHRIAGEQGAATLGGPSGTLIIRAIGALAAGLGTARFAGITNVLKRLGSRVICGDQRQIGRDRRP